MLLSVRMLLHTIFISSISINFIITINNIIHIAITKEG